MYIEPIKTDDDYQRALARIESRMVAATRPPPKDELELYSLLVSAYEDKHHPIGPPDPVEAILFRLEQLGMDRSALEPILGSRARVSEVLNHKRRLSLNMIRSLHAELQIPLEVLIKNSQDEESHARSS
jgi:HTH-type transcriptional regulator/antitoxin HigA